MKTLCACARPHTHRHQAKWHQACLKHYARARDRILAYTQIFVL